MDTELTGPPAATANKTPGGGKETDETPARGSPRHQARRNATDTKIAEGVFDVLRTRGLRGLSIEAVAAEAGVAKTTIYRRYTDRYDMLTGVSTQLTVSLSASYPVTAEGLAHLLTDIFDVFDRHGGGQVISAVLVDGREEVVPLRTSLLDPIVDRIRVFFTDGVAAGALRSDADADLLVDLFLGGIMVATCRGDLNLTWVTTAVGFMWPLLTGPNEDPARSA